jgi:RNA polymerase-binding transcription factor DksA
MEGDPVSHQWSSKMHSSTQVRARLQQRRHELSLRSGRIGSDLRREAVPPEGGFADQAATRANDEVLDAIQASALTEMRQIDHALRRLEEGRYDRCESCGGLIAPERLEAVPFAATCAACGA